VEKNSAYSGGVNIRREENPQVKGLLRGEKGLERRPKGEGCQERRELEKIRPARRTVARTRQVLGYGREVFRGENTELAT